MIARLLLVLLMASVAVAWSPRYWPVALLHTGIFLLAAAWLLCNRRQGSQPPGWSVEKAAIAAATGFIGTWGAVQLALGSSVYRFQTMRASLYWGANAVALWLASKVLRERRARRHFLTGLVDFAGAVAVIGLLQYFTSPYTVYWMFPLTHHSKAVGPFVYRNQFAAFVELVLPIALYRVMQEERGRSIATTVAAILLAAVIATGSRAGTLLVMVEMALIFALGWWRGMVSRRTLAIAITQVVGLAAVFTLVVGFQDVWSRFEETNPYALRGKLTRSTLQMIRTRPLMGYGLGTWQTVYPEFASFDNSQFANEAHNDWAQWTAEGGVFFGLALVSLAAWATTLAWPRGPKRKECRIWGIGITFVFIHSLIDYPMREPVIGALLFVIAGAVLSDT